MAENMRRACLFWAAFACAAIVPAPGQPAIPDPSGPWTHPAFPWYEPPAEGSAPFVTNLSRWAEQLPAGLAGSAAQPAGKVGISDYDQLVGDYNNPILQPWAADVVKRHGEQSLKGITFGNPSNQCWPFPPPFIFKEFSVQFVQQPD